MIKVFLTYAKSKGFDKTVHRSVDLLNFLEKKFVWMNNESIFRVGVGVVHVCFLKRNMFCFLLKYFSGRGWYGAIVSLKKCFSLYKGRFLEFRKYHNFAKLFSKLSESTFYKEISQLQ